MPRIPKLYFNRWSLFDEMINASDTGRAFYEVGVWRGESFRYFMKSFSQGYGFDTFEGLPEDWHEIKSGAYSSEGKIPEVDGAEFIKGRFDETLPDFLSVGRPMAGVINFDADMCSSTICALDNARSVIDTTTVLIFDEFLVNNDRGKDEIKL